MKYPLKNIKGDVIYWADVDLDESAPEATKREQALWQALDDLVYRDQQKIKRHEIIVLRVGLVLLCFAVFCATIASLG